VRVTEPAFCGKAAAALDQARIHGHVADGTVGVDVACALSTAIVRLAQASCISAPVAAFDAAVVRHE
jgi:hypothetical protein